MKSMRNLDELDQTVDLSITLVLRIDYGTARSTERAREGDVSACILLKRHHVSPWLP